SCCFNNSAMKLPAVQVIFLALLLVSSQDAHASWLPRQDAQGSQLAGRHAIRSRTRRHTLQKSPHSLFLIEAPIADSGSYVMESSEKERGERVRREFPQDSPLSFLNPIIQFPRTSDGHPPGLMFFTAPTNKTTRK
ncbi:hypothetical protein OTU49_015565, partial [Cherax quadricarinatus]